MDRCPKCSSQSYTPPACLICGYSAWTPGGDGDFRMASERRLGAAFAERDRVLDGMEAPMSDDGKEDGVVTEGKTYTCSVCEVTFPTRQGLAGHGRGTTHKAKVASAQGPPAAVQEAALWAAPPTPADPRPENGLPCPVCGHDLPATVLIVAKDFEQQGVDEVLAVQLAARAYGLLRVPA